MCACIHIHNTGATVPHSCFHPLLSEITVPQGTTLNPVFQNPPLVTAEMSADIQTAHTLQARQAKASASLKFVKPKSPIAVPTLAAETHSMFACTVNAL